MSALRKPAKKTNMTDGTTPHHSGDIIECALNNDFHGVDKILKTNPEKINAQRQGVGVTALMVAGGAGLEEMVSHLLSKPDIDLDIVDKAGRTALDHARVFPKAVALIVAAKYPDHEWAEPNIKPVGP